MHCLWLSGSCRGCWQFWVTQGNSMSCFTSPSQLSLPATSQAVNALLISLSPRPTSAWHVPVSVPLEIQGWERDINSVHFIGTFSSLVLKSSHPGNTESSRVGDQLLCLYPVPWHLMFRFYKREGGRAGPRSGRVGRHSNPADWTRKGYCFMKDNASFHHGFQRVNSGPTWQQVLLLTEPS